MKATSFAARRLPKIGDLVLDRLTGEWVSVVSIERRNLIRVRARSGGDSYGRSARYFDWTAKS